jgi:hypothetical protein
MQISDDDDDDVCDELMKGGKFSRLSRAPALQRENFFCIFSSA